MPTIRIDKDVYAWLKSQAIPFEDTPNSVLRKIAGLNKHKDINNSSVEENRKGKQMGTISVDRLKKKQPTGKYLKELWNVNVVHALYHIDGTWYENLRDFPGALFDLNGYVIFNTEEEYISCPYLSIGQQLNVREGISSIPGYKRVR